MEFSHDMLGMSVRDFVSAVSLKRSSEIRRNSDLNPVKVIRVSIDLTTARSEGNPFPVKFPFSSLRVEAATDSLTNCQLSLGSDAGLQMQNYSKLVLNDSMEFDDTINAAFLTWSAQSGKTMTLVFYVDCKFRSGSQLSLNAGGVSISEGSAFAQAIVSLTADRAVEIFSSNANRKVGQFYNDSGASIWVGGSSVTNTGSTKGFEILPGEKFFWKNSSALYGYSVAGFSALSTLEET